MVDISRCTVKNQETEKIFYPNIPSSIAPISHNLELPIPQRSLTLGRSNYDLSSISSEEDHTNFKDDARAPTKLHTF